MRKAVFVFLAAILALSLVACGGDPSPDGSSSAPSVSHSVESTVSLPESDVPSQTTATTTAASATTASRRPIRPPATTAPPSTTQNEFERPKTVLVGKEGENNVVYQFGEYGLVVREAILDSGRGGDAVEIVQITDAHVAFDITERMNWQTCLRYAAQYDYTVATGDLIEALHTDLTNWLKNSLANNPNTMLVLGNHEWNPTKGTPEEMSDRYALLQEYWPNDVLYSSEVVKNKVMLIQLDNSQSKFHTEQIAKLQADLKTAREKGCAVLLFYHLPLRTQNPDEMKVKALLPSNPKIINSYNFRSGYLRGTENDATGQIYDIITSNADVIKGAFCGHLHEDIYTEIVAKTPDGQDAVIPQYINHAGRYGNGHVLKITVK